MVLLTGCELTVDVSPENTVVISSTADLYTKTNPIPFELDFSQDVTTLSSEELNAGQSSQIIDIRKASATRFLVDVKPLKDGLVRLSVEAGVAREIESQSKSQKNSIGRYFDTTGPSMPIILLLGQTPNSLTLGPRLTYVSGVDELSGWQLDQIQLRRKADDAVIVDWTPFQSGETLQNLNLGKGETYFYQLRSIDQLGTPGPIVLSETWVAKADPIEPTLATTATSPTNRTPIPVTLSFNVPVAGFSLSTLNLENAVAENLRGSDKEFQFDLRPTGEGSVKVSIAKDKLSDAWNNKNIASNEMIILYDSLPPTLIFQGAPNGTINSSSASIAIEDSNSSDFFGLKKYRFKVAEGNIDCSSASGYSAEPIEKTTPINLDLRRFGNGLVTLCAVGADVAGNWQSFGQATSTTWTLIDRPTAILSGVPDAIDSRSTLAITVSGSAIEAYQYKLGEASAVNCADPSDYSSETAISSLIEKDLVAYSEGSRLKICVVGGVSNGLYQSFAQASEYTWIKDSITEANIGYLGESYNDTNQNLTFNVTLNQPRPYAVTLSFAPYGTSIQNQDFNLSTQTVTIAAGMTSAAVDFSILRNPATNPEKSLNFRLTSSSMPGVTMGPLAFQFNTIKDSESSSSGILAINAGSGSNHTCLVRDDDKLLCWGANTSGQLGNGTTDFLPIPTLIDAGVSYRKISAGRSHSCGLTTDDKIRCWGDNTYGQIGNGTTGGTVLNPVSIDGNNTYSQVYAGYNRTCALRKDSGSAYCWGQNNFGQIGDGSQTNRSLPTLVAGGDVFQQIAAGGDATCGILTNNSLKCWGGNSLAAVGDGTTSHRLTPVLIDDPTKFKFVANSLYHGCAITTADKLKCWGYNPNGQVGDDSTATRTAPVFVDTNTNYQFMSLGGYHTCGITDSGALKCWGRNDLGQLGNGGAASLKVPALIDSGTTYQQIATGFYFVCGLTSKGTLKCWGDSSLGLLGDNMTNTRSTPQLIANAEGFTEIVPSFSHSCGLTAAGKVKCWGLNGFGELGDGTTRNSAIPVDVDPGTSYKQLAVGKNHTCGLTKHGTVKCWGQNTYGQVGDGTNLNRLLPQIIDPTTTYLQIATADSTICGITQKNKTIKCWGLNNRGTVGDGTTTHRNSPTSVNSALTFEKISMSSQHACALTTDKGIQCWGYNSFGQVADGTTAHKYVPTSIIDPGTLYADVVTGQTGVCAVTQEGVIKCWGHNGYGQLLDGTTINRATPQVLNSGLNLKSIYLGSYNLCGITDSGTLHCWGYNWYGQVGDGKTTLQSPLTAIDSGTTYSKLYPAEYRFIGLTSDGKFKTWGSYELYQDANNQWIPPWLPHPILNVGE